MHFLYPALTRHYRWCIAVMSLLLLTWHKDTCSWQWQKKNPFKASSPGLYEFTCMPFDLSNAGSSFCRLMEQCLGDQQFVTFLLYLDDILIFAPDVSAMLDQIELVFNQLRLFNRKIRPKMSFLSGQCDFSGTCLVS